MCIRDRDISVMLTSFIDFGNKNFKFSTNVIFYFAVIIIAGQIIGTGTRYFNAEEFETLYKPLNVVFSVMTVLMSVYLYLISTNWYIKVARISFLVISVFYFIISVIWWFHLFSEGFDVTGFRVFFAVFISFLAISFKIANLGNYNIHPAVLFIISFVFLILFGSLCLMYPQQLPKA